MRAAWKGSISFGLVTIPVRLLSATRERQLRFKILDRQDMAPITYEKVAREDGKLVSEKDIVKGYEIYKGQYVILEREDFKRIRPGHSDTIDVVGVTDPAYIDLKLITHPYYVEPSEGGEKAYALLRDALREAGRAAIVRFVLRDRERLGALIPEGQAILLLQLRFAEDVPPPNDLNLPGKLYSDHEMKTAQALLQEMNRPFNPRDFRDTYAQELRQLIKNKARGKVSRPARAPIRHEELSDLLETLKKSLAEEHARTKH